MIRSIVGWSLSFRLLAIPVAGLLMVLGVLQLRSMPVDVLPEFTPPYVEIQTEALGLSASEVEQLITVPMERDLLNGVAGIETIRSESVLGLSSVTLVFEPGTDLMDARQLVQERLLQSGRLPNVSSPPTMLQPLSSESRVLMVGLAAKDISLTEMGVLARWTIRPRLMGVPGVANVVIWGQRDHQLQVLVDPAQLRERRVSLQQVVSTAGNAQLVSPLSFLEASTPGSGGFIDTPNQRLQVRHVMPIGTPEGLRQVPLEAVAPGEPEPRLGGQRLRLGDVARVVEDHQPLIGDALVNDRTGLYLVIEKFPGANTREVTRDVEAALDALRPGLAGIEVEESVFSPASYIESARENIALALLVGGALLALVLLALLFQWRTALVALVAVPASLLTAVLVLGLRGETMNALVLAGLLVALGIVVDDAVTAAEAVGPRLRDLRRGDVAPAALVRDALLELRSPLAFGTLVCLVAVLPVFFLAGRPGDFFEPVALSYVLAVLASTAVALTLTPALALVLLSRGDARRREPPAFRALLSRYQSVLAKTVAKPLYLLAGAAVVGLLGLAVLPFLGQSLVPTFKERDLLIQVEAAPGTSRPEMARLTGAMGEEVRSLPGVRDVGAHVGRAVMGDRVVGTSSAELWVSLDSDADYEETVARVRSVVGGYPGIDEELVTYSNDRVRAVGSLEAGTQAGTAREDGLGALRGSAEPLVVRVYGRELDTLRQKAEEVRETLAGIDGVRGARVEAEVSEPTIEVAPNIAAAQRYGIKPGDIRRAAATLVQGIVVGALFEEQKVFDVIVVGVPSLRHSVGSIENLPIDTADGGQVRLADVATVRVSSTPNVIRREAVSRRLDILANVEGRSLGAVTDDVREGLAQIDFPVEYHAEIVDHASDLQSADRRLLIVAIAAALGILLLVQAALGSWPVALAFIAALPVALAGGLVAALAVDRASLSLGAAAGLLTVFSIAVRNGLMLVRRMQRRRREGEKLGPALVVGGAQEQLAPSLTTAAAVLAVLAPFLVLPGAAGFEILHPLAVVVLGGLVTTTFFTLFLLPGVYLLVGTRDELAREEMRDLVGDLTPRAPGTAAKGSPLEGSVSRSTYRREEG